MIPLTNLRIRLRSLGLDWNGTRKMLEERLLNYEKSIAPPVHQPMMVDLTTEDDEPNPLASNASSPKKRKSPFERLKRRFIEPTEERKQRNNGFKRPMEPDLQVLLEMGVKPGHFEEINVEKLEERAELYSDVPTLKKRRRRFEEETAYELVNITNAKVKNDRLRRFKQLNENNFNM